MQETGSKFLFDQSSQGNLKFEENIAFSPFNTRFLTPNSDFYVSKFYNDAAEK